MGWIIAIIAFLAGVVVTGLFYRRNSKKMDKVVDKAKEAVKSGTTKIVGKIKSK